MTGFPRFTTDQAPGFCKNYTQAADRHVTAGFKIESNHLGRSYSVPQVPHQAVLDSLPCLLDKAGRRYSSPTCSERRLRPFFCPGNPASANKFYPETPHALAHLRATLSRNRTASHKTRR